MKTNTTITFSINKQTKYKTTITINNNKKKNKNNNKQNNHYFIMYIVSHPTPLGKL